MRFRDRRDAGRRLAERVVEANLSDPVVLALPRGGVPVALEVARALDAPLEVFVARKVGAPHHPEFGIGAVAEGGGRVVDHGVLRRLGLSEAGFGELARRQEDELRARVDRYRAGRPLPDIHGRSVVLVDDGLATGVTAEAALRGLLPRQPHRLVLAVPVCAAQTAERLASLAEVIWVLQPTEFRAVGEWYAWFDQTTDAEVLRCLSAAPSGADTR